MNHLLLLLASFAAAPEENAAAWPPALSGSVNGTVTITSDTFLKVPPAVEEAKGTDGAASFIVAKSAPTVELAFHGVLGPDAVNRRLWSSWGDICVAKDGRVYCGIGDHGNDVGGDARCFLYCWDPKDKTLRQVADMNQIVPPRAGQPAWSKIHARIDEGADEKIYFSCTLNDGNRAGRPDHGFNDQLPGGQIYQYDPATGKTAFFANLPPRRCTATSIIDQERNIWWCNLEAGEGNALWGLDLNTKQVVYQAADGTLGFNRAFALAADGSLYFNGEEGGIWKCDPQAKQLSKTKSSFADSPGMRCASHESNDGNIYGSTHQTNQLFRYSPSRDELTLLGPNFLSGEYTTVMLLSPDERFLYYLPGAHGGAFKNGTSVVQYDLKTGQQKVLAFLAETIESKYGYVPAGTYGAKLSADGAVLYVNFNGHAADSIRPAHMKPNGFGLTAFAAIHIPASER
jgi:sugar lactone lactonase YvrE